MSQHRHDRRPLQQTTGPQQQYGWVYILPPPPGNQPRPWPTANRAPPPQAPGPQSLGPLQQSSGFRPNSHWARPTSVHGSRSLLGSYPVPSQQFSNGLQMFYSGGPTQSQQHGPS